MAYTTKDQFQRGDSASSLGSSPQGQAWTALSGTWGINGNTAYLVAGGWTAATIETGLSDVILTSVFSTVTNGQKIVFRATDANNYLYCRWLNTNTLTFRKYVAGIDIGIAAVSAAMVNGSRLDIMVSGSTVSAWVDFVQVLTPTTDSFNQTATKHGIGQQSVDASRWSFFGVQPYVTPGGNVFTFTTTGTALGDGTTGDPWDMGSACEHYLPRDGDFVQGAGNYSGNYTISLKGVSDYVTFRNTPSQRFNLIGTLLIAGAATKVVVLGDALNFRVNGNGCSDATPTGGDCIHISGTDCHVRNTVVHDGQNGFGTSSNPTESIYGSISYNNGYFNDGIFGHNFYCQSDPTGATVHGIEENIYFHAHAYGIHCYGQAGALKNLLIKGNISCAGSANNDYFVGGTGIASQVSQFVATENEGYSCQIQWGYNYHPNTDITHTNNYWVSRSDTEVSIGVGDTFTLFNFTSATLSGNTIIHRKSAPRRAVDVGFYSGDGANPNTYAWDTTTYWIEEASPPVAAWLTGDVTTSTNTNYATLAAWRSGTTLDAHSTATFGALPSTNRVVVRPNAYETGRANIAAYNWEHTATCAADVSATGLATYDTYAVYHVFDLNTPVATGTYAGAPITLPMQNMPVPPVPVLGWQGADVYFPDLSTGTVPFAAFVLLKTGTDVPVVINNGLTNMPRWRTAHGARRLR